MASPMTWLRVNAQHYLLRDSQARVARQHGLPAPDTGGSVLWTKIFIPVYRVLPWGFRSRFMTAMPGSHRQGWTPQSSPEGPAI